MQPTNIVPQHQSGRSLTITSPITEKVRSALELWLSGFSSGNTRNAYRKEIEAFATFAGREDVAEAVAHFLALEDGQAHAVADAWRAAKLEKGLSPASINRSMSALNSLVASARRHGLTALRLEAKGVKSRAYRDTRGPGIRGVQSLLTIASEQTPEKAARDAAIIRLACGLGLRRGEIASLDIAHVDLSGGKILVLGKGRTEREALTLPANVRQALEAWLALRGNQDRNAPLFVGLDRASKGNGRISGAGIYHIITAQLGAKAGVTARPHGLRHTAITAALDAFNGDYRKTRAFSRHASLDTVRKYDDNRADHAGQVATALDSIFGVTEASAPKHAAPAQRKPKTSKSPAAPVNAEPAKRSHNPANPFGLRFGE